MLGWEEGFAAVGGTRQWEARTGKRLPAAATLCGALDGLARDGGMRAPAPTGTQPRRRQARGQTARTAPLSRPCKTKAKKIAGTLPHRWLARG
jgi:hypothetical protein